MRAKHFREILDDATLVCWYSFDRDSSADSGPLRLNGTSMNITFVPGRIDRAINFTSNSSYFQVRTINCLIYFDGLYRLLDLFFLGFQIIPIQLHFGFIHTHSRNQFLFTVQQ